MKLIRDSKYVREDYKFNESLIEFETNRLQAEIEQIEESSVVALVGAYGVGKSTSLYNISLGDKDPSDRWFQFDAWRYPERKGLWDGLIIELAKEIGVANKAVRKIDGNKSVIGKWGGMVGEFFNQFGESLPKVELDKIIVDPKVAEGVAKISEKASSVFGRSPAKRAYEMERILADVLLSVKEQTIYLIVEDVDRSGSDGINFLETLNYFIKNNEQLLKSNKKIVVIATISDKAYFDNKESLYKCIDLFIEHRPIVKSSEAFLKNVFTDEALGKQLTDDLRYLQDIESFFNQLLETPSYKVNIRTLKLIIRQTNQRYIELSRTEENVDWRAVLVIESMRIAQDEGRNSTLLEAFRLTGEIPSGNIFSALLRTIYTPSEHIFQYKYTNDRSKENRFINPRSMAYKPFRYGGEQHSKTSVWEGWSDDDHDKTRGYIADYYDS